MNLSKTKYCEAVQCNKMLWLDTYKSDVKVCEENDSVLDNGTLVGEYARDLFGKHVVIDFNSNVSKMVDDTKEAIDRGEPVICEASFVFDNNFCSVDILVCENDGYKIYEVKSSTKVTDIYIEDASYQYYVLSMLGYNVKGVYIVTLNPYYKRNGELNLKKLFNISDVTNDAILKKEGVKEKIDEIREYLSMQEEPTMNLGMHCVNPYNCPFFKYCSRELPVNNVFNVRQMQNSTKFKLYNKGVYKYEDLLKEKIGDKFKQQIEFELSDKEPYIDRDAISKFLDTLSYPLYFLDFETYQQAIPEFDGVSPYMQIPFQYSLHFIKKEGGALEHTEFLGDSVEDPRRKLALQLVHDIPMDVCTVAFNMRFEKKVINDLAQMYPDLSEHLMNIHDNMKDLMVPFRDRKYYAKDMHGSFSIKYVLPALFSDDASLNYKNLELVHNGSEAMATYANLRDKSPEEQEYIRDRLLRYCELDTYAMVKIWWKLQEVTERLTN